MCMAIPGKVEKVSGNRVTVNFDGIKKEAASEFFESRVGDWVLVFSGHVMEKIPEERALKILKDFRDAKF